MIMSQSRVWGPAAAVALAGSSVARGDAPFPPAVLLSALNGTDGFNCAGVEGDQSGFSISGAGDVNGDTFDDLIIGAPLASPGGRTRAGSAYVVFGGPSLESFFLTGLNGSNGFRINGVTALDNAGRAVAGAGDVNGDGFDDVIVGARYADPGGHANAGTAYVVFGGATVGASGVIELSVLDGSDGFAIPGVVAESWVGESVAGAGRVNGDGFDDIVVGGGNGSHVIFGGPTIGSTGSLAVNTLNGTNGFAVLYVGGSVASAGDINGDGFDDPIIGATFLDAPAGAGAGGAVVVFGGAAPAPTGVFDPNLIDGENRFIIWGAGPNHGAGTSVSGAGDVNGDLVDDLIIGAPFATVDAITTAGRAYVVYGDANIGAGASLDLTTIDGSNGFSVNGDTNGGLLGYFVSSCGDVNGDNYSDVVVGAPGAQGQGFAISGEAYVVFGGAAPGASGTVAADDLNGTDGFAMYGQYFGDRAGWSVAGAGDMNGDGVRDIAVGAYAADLDIDTADVGRTYVVFGRVPVVCPGDTNTDGLTNISDFNILAGNFGQAVTPNTGGDLTGDGVVNILDFNILAGDFGCGG